MDEFLVGLSMSVTFFVCVVVYILICGISPVVVQAFWVPLGFVGVFLVPGVVGEAVESMLSKRKG